MRPRWASLIGCQVQGKVSVISCVLGERYLGWVWLQVSQAVVKGLIEILTEIVGSSVC